MKSACVIFSPKKMLQAFPNISRNSSLVLLLQDVYTESPPYFLSSIACKTTSSARLHANQLRAYRVHSIWPSDVGTPIQNLQESAMETRLGRIKNMCQQVQVALRAIVNHPTIHCIVLGSFVHPLVGHHNDYDSCVHKTDSGSGP